MADLGYVKAILRGIEDERTRRILDEVFTHVLSNLRFGVPEPQARATNFQAYWQQSTTASDTAEFTIAHGLPTAPHYAIPALDVSQPGAKLVNLEVSRAADAKRIYLKVPAGSTGVPITVLTEW